MDQSESPPRVAYPLSVFANRSFHLRFDIFHRLPVAGQTAAYGNEILPDMGCSIVYLLHGEPAIFVRQTASAVVNATTAMRIARITSNQEVNHFDLFVRAPSEIGVFYAASIAYPGMNPGNLPAKAGFRKEPCRIVMDTQIHDQ